MRSQVSRLGTESFIPNGTQKPTEGTGYPPYLWRKPMAKVTYRGVEYDTDEYNARILDENAKRNRHDLMYRGLKVRSKAKACS